MSELIVDDKLPAGNILADRIEGDEVHLRVDPRDTEGFWFYWCFRVRGAAGRRLRFRFAEGPVFTVRGPAISLDRGRSWRWLGMAEAGEWYFDYAFSPDEHCVWFSMGMPYTAYELERFLAAHSNSAHLRRDVLCLSRGEREVDRLHVGRLDREPAHRIVLTARHHACEMMADYVMEGVLGAALGADELGAWYREKVEILAVPFMDKDGVEKGDQGKNRRPHDHNRDYGEAPIHPEVRALKRFVPAWGGGRLHAALDLHCPYIRGGKCSESIYLVGSPKAEVWQAQQAFGAVLEDACREGPLPYRVADNLPFGQEWNNSSFGETLNCSHWFTTLPDVRLVTSVEIPYAQARDTGMSSAGARGFGRCLAVALRQYLAGA